MKEKENPLLLKDVGEFALLKDHIFPCLSYSKEYLGDDCAFISFPKIGKDLVITTDAGPKPLFFNEDRPYYFIWGWYTVLANVSDLASTGCFPLALSLAVEASSEMKVDDLKEYFNGVNAASKAFGIPISGGNIKANTKFISNATAFGYLKETQKNLKRSECQPGDIVISLGDNGLFITAYLNWLEEGYEKLTNSERRKLKGPFPQILQMQEINSGFKVTAASDNSDGILGSLWNIADSSYCGFILDLDKIKLPSYIKRYSIKHKIDPWNLFFFWGDWQVIITINPKQLKKFESFCVSKKIKFTVLGKAKEGEPQLKAVRSGKELNVKLVRNENFSKLSYNNDISTHINYLLKENLFN